MSNINLQIFPTETLQHIFSYLTTYDLNRVSLVCEYFKEIISSFNLPKQSTLTIRGYNRILEENNESKWLNVTFSEAMCLSFPEETIKNYHKFWNNIGKHAKTISFSTSKSDLLHKFNMVA